MSPPSEFIEITEADVDRGYRSCRQSVRHQQAGRTWFFLNLPGDVRQAVDSLLYLFQQGIMILDDEFPHTNLPSSPASERVAELRDQLNDALCKRYLSVEWAAIAQTTERFRVPKQFLFDFIAGVDHAVRFGTPDSWDILQTRASLLGGSSLAALVRVMGVEKPDYAVPAIRCGMALLLSHWLTECRRSAQRKRSWLATQDLIDAHCTLETLNGREFSKPVSQLVNLYCHRIESLFQQAKPLLAQVDFDCARALRGMIGAAWKPILKLQRNPESLFEFDGPISRAEEFALKARYVLGIDSELPFATGSDGGAH